MQNGHLSSRPRYWPTISIRVSRLYFYSSSKRPVNSHYRMHLCDAKAVRGAREMLRQRNEIAGTLSDQAARRTVAMAAYPSNINLIKCRHKRQENYANEYASVGHLQ